MTRRTPRLVAGALAGLVAATALVASPASAKAVDPAPSTATTLDCYADPALVAITTPDLAVNTAGAAGCVAVRVAPGSLRLAWVVTNPGWTYVVKSNGGGSASRVQIAFTNRTTGQRVDFRFQFGLTKIS